MLCITQLCLEALPATAAGCVCAATSDWGEKNFSNVVSQQVLYFLFDIALSDEKQIPGGFRGSDMCKYISPLVPGPDEIYNLSLCLHDMAKIISLKK